MVRRKTAILFVTGLLLLLVGFILGGYVERKRIAPPTSSTALPTLTVPAEFAKETFLVTKVIDGDTIQIEGGRTVRYIGIDAPETHDRRKGVQCFADEATAKNRGLVEGKEVRLEKDVSETDKFGRLLRYVYVGKTFVNDLLVRLGYATAATFPPDVMHQSKLLEAQKEARENNRGLWALCQ